MEIDSQFFVGLLEIIAVNIVLSGDNAVVIALACRALPPRQQKIGIMLGAGLAVLLRIAFTVFIVYLMTVPYLKIAGALLLLWIGYKLLEPQDAGHDVDAAQGIWQAVRIVLVADAVMSLDNVIAVAAAAKGSIVLLVLGLIISVPLVVYGAQLMIKLIDRFPIIIIIGAGLIGYIAGEVFVTDPAIEPWVNLHAHWLRYAAPAAGAVGIVVLGQLMARKPAVPETVTEAIAAPAALFGLRLALLLVARVLATRAPLIVAFVATLLGYGGGQVLMQEPGVSGWADAYAPIMHTVGPIVIAFVTVAVTDLIFRALRRRRGGGSQAAE